MLKVYIDRDHRNKQKVRRLFVSYEGPPIVLFDGQPGQHVDAFTWGMMPSWEPLTVKEVM